MNNKFLKIGGISRYEVIDFLRGFSILTIVIMHIIISHMNSIPNIIQKASLLGGTGVHAFMFCSGFGLYLSQLRNEKNFVGFMKHRFVKIYIPYIVIVLVYAAVPFIYQGDDKIVAILSHVFLFKMFSRRYESSFGAHFWFVSTIIQFYVLFIPLCKIKKILGNKIFLVLCTSVSVAWWCLVGVLGKTDSAPWFYFCLQFLWEFALGMILADWLYSGKTIEVRHSVLMVIAVIGILMEGIMGILEGNWKLFNDILASAGYISLVALIYEILDANRQSKILDTLRNLAVKISGFSYEWYLVHILVMEIVWHFLSVSSVVVDCTVGVVVFCLSIVAAIGYKKLIREIRRMFSLIKDIKV